MFLFNSGMVGLAGGIIGGVLGVFSSYLLSIFLTGALSLGRMSSGSTTIVNPQIVLLVLGLSILIGILSGIIPAYRASKMNPVDALRYE
jgi:putative ABC transport system permease protein